MTYKYTLDAVAVLWQIAAQKGNANNESQGVKETFMAADTTPTACQRSNRLSDRRDD
jgi:hypothetical protein